MRSIGREWENYIGRGLLKETFFLKKSSSLEKILKNWKINCMRRKKIFGEEEKENWKKNCQSWIKFKRTKGEEES